MSMGVMYERLGPDVFEWWAERYKKVTAAYCEKFLGKERVFVRGQGDFTIQVLSEWNHRFFGVTKEGIPIWAKKRRQFRYLGNDINSSVKPKDQAAVFQSDKECQTEEVTSFVKWKNGNAQLAFIYLGILWTLEEGETLNDAAMRFIMTHQEVKRRFRRCRKRGEHLGIPEDQIYIYELFRDGALVFYNGKAMLKEEHTFYGTLSGLWAIMVAEGFFAKENVKEVEVGTDFYDWYKT